MPPLIPTIIDHLFNRNITDYGNLRTELMRKISEMPDDENIELVFNLCWDMERAMMNSTDLAKDCIEMLSEYMTSKGSETEYF